MVIAITLENGKARVNPVEFLGRELFERYRVVCDRMGALFNRDAKANIAELSSVPALKEQLTKAGFIPRLHPELEAALGAREGAATAARAGAGGRLALVTAAMAKSGLAPFPYQAVGIDWLAPRQAALLCDEPGLGKTIQALVAAPPGPILVIPPAIAKGVWLRETLRWRPDLQPYVCTGRGSFRWPGQNEIVIINGDILPPLEEALPSGELIKLFPFANPPANMTVIVDECHLFKSGKAQRTMRLRKLLKSAWAAGGRVWGLTGTPLLNRPEELASLLSTFGLFNECFGSWTRYLRVMCGQKKYWGGFEWGKPKQEAIDGIKKVMLRRLRKDVLPDLPEKIYEPIPVEIDSEAQRLCDEAREALQAQGISLAQVIFEARSLGGAFECIARVRKALATAKLPATLDLLEEYEESQEPVLVFSAHRPPIDVLGKRSGWASITGDTPAHRRTELEELFQAGHLKGLALTIDAGGTAITLTRAHQAIFVDLEWTPAINQQAEDRICRIGQTRGVIIKRLFAQDTIDQDVEELLRGKQKIIDQTINAAATRPEQQVNLL